MDTKKIDSYNIVLVILSLIIAIKAPFKLFLFSYAILGPLHYLTEINWLNDKSYFVTSTKKWMTPLILTPAIISIYPLLQFSGIDINNTILNGIKLLATNNSTWLLATFIFSASLIILKKPLHLALSLVFSILLAAILKLFVPETIVILAILLPTLIHVYLFTLLFVIYGALKSKSKQGLKLGLIITVIPLIIWLLPIEPKSYTVSIMIQDFMNDSTFLKLNDTVITYIGALKNEKFYALSEAAIRVQIFIAFAYTYHYLNWFSKTSIIGWKDAISKKKGGLIIGLWITSVALYFYDFKTGLMAILFLSYLHVFLEFPLNMVSIKGIISHKKEKTHIKEPIKKKLSKKERLNKKH